MVDAVVVQELNEFNQCDVKNNPDVVRFVLISDTHTYTKDLILPAGDILIHAGDFSFTGRINEVKNFNDFLGSVKDLFKHIVVICGNHELYFDKKFQKSPEKIDYAKSLLTNCIYLQDEAVELMGFRIYGTPWTPLFRDDAFNIPRNEIIEKLNTIPDNTDVLVTHGPPYGYGDRTVRGCNNVGCKDLLETVKKRVKPKLHVFGHIHEGYGISKDENTVYINASICTKKYFPTNKPTVVDMKKPTSL